MLHNVIFIHIRIDYFRIPLAARHVMNTISHKNYISIIIDCFRRTVELIKLLVRYIIANCEHIAAQDDDNCYYNVKEKKRAAQYVLRRHLHKEADIASI